MAVILGGKSRTLSGLSGVGDTFGTCFGPLSRNRNFGIRLGKGESMKEILASSTEVRLGACLTLLSQATCAPLYRCGRGRSAFSPVGVGSHLSLFPSFPPRFARRSS